MGILRALRTGNILQNDAVQPAAASGYSRGPTTSASYAVQSPTPTCSATPQIVERGIRSYRPARPGEVGDALEDMAKHQQRTAALARATGGPEPQRDGEAWPTIGIRDGDALAFAAGNQPPI